MKTNEFLKNYQPLPYKIFYNALKNDTFSHAYILSGKKGSSLDKIALYLAKSLLCKNDVFACDECDICKRLDNNNYPSLFILDAKKGIKIDELRSKIESFYTSSIEKESKNIYIILNIEYLKTDCINMILKFLEEPPLNTYAIFTSENELGILPTILSRCEIIKFSSINKEYFIELAKKDNISLKDVSILSMLYNDYDEIKSNLENPSFIIAKDFIKIFIENINNKDKFIFLMEKDFIKKINQETLYFIFDLMIILFKESLKLSYHQNSSLIEFNEILIKIKQSIKNLDRKIEFLMEEENLISKNLNLNLLLIYTMKNLFEENI